MALEYVKVWTAFLDDPWVQSLNCNYRGFFLQLLILCRKSGDFSAIFRRSLSAIGAELGCDDSTCAKILRKFAEDKKILFEKRPDGVYHIEVLNYQFWQELRPEKGSRELVAKKRQTSEKSGKIQPSKPREDKPSQYIYIAEIIQDLNEKSGKSYKPDTASTVRLVTALINRGFTVDQFKYVNAVKCAEWMGGDMEKYIRPETLYGGKFESYLNQGKSAKKEETSKYDGVTING